ncbi:MAG TPA: peptidase [Allosphingosinicella sp.]|nr:peptidase [Allosphingosinicella sp.]
MTYCLGMLIDAGLVMIADTRTNAGVDNFSCYRKLHALSAGPDKQIFLASSGNLSMSQSVIGLLEEGLPAGEDSDVPRTIDAAKSMFRVAQLIGEAVQAASRTVGDALSEINLNGSLSLLVGGRVGNSAPRLFLIYPAGNFIECQREAPFFQIGETKYGRPILDRAVTLDMPLGEAVKIGFLSFDSAMRSNLGVARPLDMMVMPHDPADPILTRRIERDDPYFNELSESWSRLLREATRAIPQPPFMIAPAP